MTALHLRIPLVPLLAALGLALAGPAAADLQCQNISQLAREYLKHHVSLRALSGDIEDRAIETYLQRLDSSRSLLLQSDVAGMREKLGGIFGRLQKGDCSQLSTVQGELLERHAAAEAFVKDMVDGDYELDESVEIVIDPEERGYPATEDARRELWRKLVHFQMSNYLSAGEELDEAKRLLEHRYELRTRRARELEIVDVYSVFLDSFAASLDPHSNYLSPQAVEDFRISMSLSLEGIGVALSERDGYSVVERIIPGGAADQLENGLQPKDKIIAVAEDGGDAVNIIDMPLREAVSLIRGKAGTKVHLTVLRQGEATKRFPLTIVRDKIDLAEQAASVRFETRERGGETYKLAVLELPSFYGDSDPTERQCTDDVERLLGEVIEAKADGLVLDLSRNGGGLLEHAVKISGFFIRKGEVVGVENSRGQLSVLSDRDERILYTGPMVVHVSRISASASEILAGALKDYRRAVITGDDHTFGKGTVQTVTPLPPGLGALKITTARFFRPGGRSTQRDGVASDVVIPSLLATEDFGERHQRYALAGEEISPFLSSYANAIGPGDRWSRVPPETVEALAQRSNARVEQSQRFEEIRDELRESAERDGVVRLADILKEREAAQAESDPNGNGSGPEPAEETESEPSEEELSAQVDEALEVLADLIQLTRRES